MKKIFFTSTLFLLLFSCNRNQSENPPLIENAIDNTESSIKGSFESGRDDNMIDKIYSELIKNDKKLSALDNKILKTYEASRKALQNFEHILYKSESYYREANYHSKSITDSLLKHQIENQIKKSSEQYESKTKNIRNIISLLNKNNEKISNLYTAFKIRKTLPEIEKYQSAHPLKTDSLTQFINKQNKLLEELKILK
ncbi:hypothetical protein [Chryseobacterium oryctis]|uniref:Cell-wall binding lipoprotein n=1 Tax=Chryseobacterium oryctis TaxID=2952618 RepID=A0ABT3HRE5_9FLAO|nr:hypothetical protein [Chryseobacterium oryctis]MCW3162353.1 hypothetical protein [Chryseobacterium oryctis]